MSDFGKDGLRNRFNIPLDQWPEQLEQTFEENTNRLTSRANVEQFQVDSFGDIPGSFEDIPLDDIEINTGEIGQITETTGLIDSAAGGYGTIGATAVGTSTGVGLGTSVGIGTAVIGGTAAVGLATGLTLPGHHFVGPGNDENRPESPVDVDDEIAKEHDIGYGKANTQEDVRIADSVAIDKFKKDFDSTGNLHSLIGAVGLGAKHTLEGYTGVLYPSNLPSSIPGECFQLWGNIHYIKIHVRILIGLNVVICHQQHLKIKQNISGMLGIPPDRIKGYLE